jgi:tetratricopeptide (TPR) repeat protein
LHFDGHGSFDSVKQQGFLVFELEDFDWKQHLVSADEIGKLLEEYQIRLMVLSACQSAQVAGEDPMGSVAVQLNAAGIPAVLAMSYSILVESARRLFGAFYRNLLVGQGVGAALNGARVALFRDQARGERQRWQRRIVMNLQDWFLPALYQVGSDMPLLFARDIVDKPLSTQVVSEQQEFVGRARELWQIEREFFHKKRPKRRITISGFGGQGKTALAEEACRWLTRTGLFERTGFVSFAGFQNLETADALRYAIAVLGQALGESFLDAEAVRVYLQNTPTLIVLDNLEALGDEGLTELLDAAVGWSQAGDSRVLLTTRSPRFLHAGYPINERVHPHYSMRLEGWKEEDAIAYFQQALQSLSNSSVQLPTREDLFAIFRKVDFQPLAVRFLAETIKRQPCIELKQALDDLLSKEDSADPNRNLKASLNLSLQHLAPTLKTLLLRLGVFQGGALELMVQQITELTEDTWQRLRLDLETAGLIQMEYLPGVTSPYLKFHPTLAPVLWELLDPDTRSVLMARYQEYYYALSSKLYSEDSQNPMSTRVGALWELPNLLYAVRGALEAASSDAVVFVRTVNQFLQFFGMEKDCDNLTKLTMALSMEIGSLPWFLSRSSKADRLINAGHINTAVPLLEEILQGLATTSIYPLSLTFDRLGHCYHLMGQFDKAADCYRKGLKVTEGLIASYSDVHNYRRQRGKLLNGLANVLTDSGHYGDARQAYIESLKVAVNIGDKRDAVIVKEGLGILALLEGNLTEAMEIFQRNIKILEELNEPQSVAKALSTRGTAYARNNQWGEAELSYRQSAAIFESLGNLSAASATWNGLAKACFFQGKFDAAEHWYCKVLDVCKQLNDSLRTSKNLCSLAYLLRGQRDRLAEAQQLAEEALTLNQALDPAAAEIWTTYQILAEIAAQQGQTAAARTYRRQMRQSYNDFPGAQHWLQQFTDFVPGVVAATQDPNTRQQIEAALSKSHPSRQNLVVVIRQLLNGERDEDTLCESLDYKDSAVVCAILRDLGASSSMPGSIRSSSFSSTPPPKT